MRAHTTFLTCSRGYPRAFASIGLYLRVNLVLTYLYPDFTLLRCGKTGEKIEGRHYGSSLRWSYAMIILVCRRSVGHQVFFMQCPMFFFFGKDVVAPPPLVALRYLAPGTRPGYEIWSRLVHLIRNSRMRFSQIVN